MLTTVCYFDCYEQKIFFEENMGRDKSELQDLQVIENFKEKLKNEVSYNLLAEPKNLTIHFANTRQARSFAKSHEEIEGISRKSRDVTIEFDDISKIGALIEGRQEEPKNSVGKETDDISIRDFKNSYLERLGELYSKVSSSFSTREYFTDIKPAHYYIGFETEEMAIKFSEDLKTYCGITHPQHKDKSYPVGPLGILMKIPGDNSYGVTLEHDLTDVENDKNLISGLRKENLDKLIEARQKELEAQKKAPQRSKTPESQILPKKQINLSEIKTLVELRRTFGIPDYARSITFQAEGKANIAIQNNETVFERFKKNPLVNSYQPTSFKDKNGKDHVIDLREKELEAKKAEQANKQQAQKSPTQAPAQDKKIIEEPAQKAPVTVRDFTDSYTSGLKGLYYGIKDPVDLAARGHMGKYFVGFETREMAQKFSEDLLKYCGLGSVGKSEKPKYVKKQEYARKTSYGIILSSEDGNVVGLTEENMKVLMEGRQKELKTELSKQLAALAARSENAGDFAGKVWVNVMQELEAPKTVMERGFIKKTQPLLDEEKKAIESDVKAKAEAAYNEAKDIKEGDKAKLGIFGKLVDWLREKLGSDKSLQAKFMLNLSEKLAEKLGEKAEGQDKSHLDKVLEERAAKEAAKSSIKL